MNGSGRPTPQTVLAACIDNDTRLIEWFRIAADLLRREDLTDENLAELAVMADQNAGILRDSVARFQEWMEDA